MSTHNARVRVRVCQSINQSIKLDGASSSTESWRFEPVYLMWSDRSSVLNQRGTSEARIRRNRSCIRHCQQSCGCSESLPAQHMNDPFIPVV